ncbi:hypothetical protein [Bosea sp. BK604]|uniref:hypothetical protein n=1 Tax=Bosea sp. BK604 TaxID=2512180 RepID=UPI00104852A3|nr:hypothetical protein [Bosea sp. BK604]TCR64673.1 hypothetical protein EV560_106138 [Bosea sp. BK604]
MLVVTDHALLRLIERGHGVDVEQMRNSLVDRLQRASGAAERIGPTQYVIALDGLRYQVRDGHVVTVLTDEMASHQRKNGIAR